MDTSHILLGIVYVALGLVFMTTYGRMRSRSRALSLLWLFMGVLLSANGVLKVIQAAG